jgi:hypothetical protein
MQQANDQCRRFRFGVFEADLQFGRLTKHGKRIRLQEQPFRLLVMLLEKPGELVTREKLRGGLWPRTTVGLRSRLEQSDQQGSRRPWEIRPRIPASSRPSHGEATGFSPM